jgi:hypothetical protein
MSKRLPGHPGSELPALTAWMQYQHPDLGIQSTLIPENKINQNAVHIGAERSKPCGVPVSSRTQSHRRCRHHKTSFLIGSSIYNRKWERKMFNKVKAVTWVAWIRTGRQQLCARCPELPIARTTTLLRTNENRRRRPEFWALSSAFKI